MKKIEAEFSDHYRILFHVQKHKNIDLAINEAHAYFTGKTFTLGVIIHLTKPDKNKNIETTWEELYGDQFVHRKLNLLMKTHMTTTILGKAFIRKSIQCSVRMYLLSKRGIIIIITENIIIYHLLHC